MNVKHWDKKIGIIIILPKIKYIIILVQWGRYKRLAWSIKEDGNRMLSMGYITYNCIKKKNKNIKKTIVKTNKLLIICLLSQTIIFINFFINGINLL